MKALKTQKIEFLSITNFHKLIVKYHLSTLLSFVILFVSCSKEKIKSSASSSKNEVRATMHDMSYTDTDVFKGVMFLTGSFVDTYLHDFSDFKLVSFTTNTATINGFHSLQDSVVTRLTASNASYLSHFRDSVGSGNFNVIQRTLKRTATDVMNAMVLITTASSTYISDSTAAAASAFMGANHLTSSSTMQQFHDAVENSFDAKPTIDLKIKLKVAAYGYYVIAVAVFAVLVLFLATDSSSSSPYYFDNYTTEITSNLSGV